MKRRNIDLGKPPRRQTKRSPKFSDSVYGNAIIFLKFFMIWLLIMLGDFILEFRFEYIWPAWLLVQSVYETFKYQGLIYSVFFVCIAITSDTMCLLFIPIQYLFFLASTYVWIHFVWHTDKGFSLPSVTLWMIIMYIEVTVRLRNMKIGQLHISLCQPFAAHCIGHPILTLGIGFKSYIFYRMKIRTQQQVRKENNFYYELLRQSLPAELQHNHTLTLDKNESLHHCNGFLTHSPSNSRKSSDKLQKSSASSLSIRAGDSNETQSIVSISSNSPSSQRKLSDYSNLINNSNLGEEDAPILENILPDMELRKRNVHLVQSKKNIIANSECPSPQNVKSTTKANSSETFKLPKVQSQKSVDAVCEKHSSTNILQPSKPSKEQCCTPPNENTNYGSKVELISSSSIIEQLEKTISNLKSELANAEKQNIVSKTQIEQLSSAERAAKTELSLLQKDNESLQIRYTALVNSKEKEKLNLLSLEKKLKEEIEKRESTEKLFNEEQQRRKEYEETTAITFSNREKASAEILKNTKRDLEEKISKTAKQLDNRDAKCKSLENKIKELQAREKSVKESETLMSALEAMQEKNLLLEKSLSAETRLKLDLFSALGDAKRQLELAHAALFKREAEMTDMKARMSDFLSVMPEQRQMQSSTPHYSANFLEKTPPVIQLAPPPQEFVSAYGPVPHVAPPTSLIQPHPSLDQGIHLQAVHLDPNAAVYTPSTSEV